MTATLGFPSRLGIGASTLDTKLEFDPENTRMGKTRGVIPNVGLRGILDEQGEICRDGQAEVAGNLGLVQVKPDELAALLPWVFGASNTGTSFPLGEASTERIIWMDFGGTDVRSYSACQPMETRISSAEGQDNVLNMNIAVEGIAEDDTATFSGSPALSTQQPFLHSDLALTIGGNAIQVASFELIIRYQLHIRHLNSVNRTLIARVKREIDCNLLVPWDTGANYQALYGVGAAGAAIVATYTNGGMSLAFTMAKVQWPTEGPIMTRNELMLPINGKARKSGSTAALATVLDSTP